MPKKNETGESLENTPKGAKRTIVKQSAFPALPLNKALRIAQALWDNFAGDAAPPHEIALAIDMSPTSGPWRELCGASSAYGLTKGSYTSAEISLDGLGRRIVAPESEGDDVKARVESVMKPAIMRAFFERYDKAKFPQDNIAENVLVKLGLPKDRASAGVTALKEAGKAVGVIRDTKTGPFVSISLPKDRGATERATAQGIEGHPSIIENDVDFSSDSAEQESKVDEKPTNDRVFISHGKNRAIVKQIKELLTFGKLEPVVSVEQESTAIPVPEKVFSDMRSCSAGVIHVRGEGELLDAEGNQHIHINDNVLIEIGAAIALYGKKVVLLVEKGIRLPSNLQGLYRCEYEGDKLDYEATMKLLKTFNEFR